MRKKRRRQLRVTGLGLLFVVALAWLALAWADYGKVNTSAIPQPSYSPIFGPPSPLPTPIALAVPKTGALRYAVLGDSLAGGYFADQEKQGYATLIGDALTRKTGRPAVRVPVKNSRKKGETTIVRHFYGFAPKADLLVVELGTNDYNHDPAAVVRKNYDRLLDEIRRVDPHARLLCMGLWSSTTRTSPTKDGEPLYDLKIKRSCEVHAGTFVPMTPIFDHPGARGPKGAPTWAGPNDGFHPNTLGHRLIAQAIMEHV